MKSFVILAAVFLAGILTFGSTQETNRGQITSSRFNIKDIREHRLEIVAPSDARYASFVSSLLASKSDLLVESLMPYSILINNENEHAVVACVLKWEMVDQRGKVSTWTREYTNLPALTGKRISEVNEGLLIKPHSSSFFTPALLPVPHEETLAGQNDRPEVVNEINRTLYELNRFTSITVSLDASFFDNGLFVGPDTTKFFARVEAMQNGQRDVFLSLVGNSKRGDPANILSNLRQMAEIPEVQLGKNASQEDYYRYFKRRAALALIKIIKRDGLESALRYVASRVEQPWPTLRKQ